MRTLRRPLLVPTLLALIATAPAGAAAATTAGAPAAPAPLAADTPATTTRGNPFVAPEGWTIEVRGDATVLAAPEGDSWIALVDVPEAEAADSDAALAAGWKTYKPAASWPLIVANERSDADGWSRQRVYQYQTSPDERRAVAAFTRFAGGVWTVVLFDMSEPVAEKRGGQVATIFGRLLPKGHARESFAGREAHALDEARLAELRRFVEEARSILQVPGVAVGIVQGGEVVLAQGFGPREIGSDESIDADTLFLIASNTKALTTLLLAKLVDAGRFGWATPVTEVLPSFRLGDAATTERVRIEHLICACTGMPRQDLEWLLEFGDLTPEKALATLATMVPTSDFGALFQYSNPMAGAAGFAAGHVLHPDLELGAAYDRAMQELVFDPLGMTSTTFDYARALAGNHTGAYAQDIDGRTAPAVMAINYSVIPLRPAGGAWSNVRDVLRYVRMELDRGLLPDGRRYISEEKLLARRAKQVALGQDSWYGMGLTVDRTWGVEVVHHGGDLIGHHSDMLWLPEHGVGAVVLTNGDPGWTIRNLFQRKLLEVLFDGEPEADARLAAAAKSYFESLAANRKLLTAPADPAAAAALAGTYVNAALGSVAVSRQGGRTSFDFGEYRSEVATKVNPDGTTSFVTIAPGIVGLEFVVRAGEKPSLVMRDAQHEYVFEAR
jgi:CubicO group peptidase (beta-lactamase class C family)